MFLVRAAKTKKHNPRISAPDMYEWFISLRYLRAKHKHGFISLISFISVAGITVGVIALMVVLAVYSGFTDGLRDQILGLNSHIVVQQLGGPLHDYEKTRERILQIKDVEGATPYLYSQTLLSSPAGGSGAIMRGIDPNTAEGVINLPEQMIHGSIHDLTRKNEDNIPNVILGKNLAQDLRELEWAGTSSGSSGMVVRALAWVPVGIPDFLV